MKQQGEPERPQPPHDKVRSFYDEFSSHLLDDFVMGNARVSRQFKFLSEAIPPGVGSVLVIGFGSGYVARFVAKIARDAAITGIDISAENVRLATAAFAHKRVRYLQGDVVCHPIEGTFEVVVLPDVYEHIPKTSRQTLHFRLRELLKPRGRLLITVPSPGHQIALRQSGRGLQIVDETVSIADLLTLAREVGGSLTYYNSISVWLANDYIHAVVELDASSVRPISDKDRVPLKGWRKTRLWKRVSAHLYTTSRMSHLHQLLRRWLLLRRLLRGEKSAREGSWSGD